MEIVDIELDQIDSTQTYAHQHHKEFDNEKITCITAEEQTKGRGRYDRSWYAPKGVNLLVTFYFQLPSRVKSIGCLCQVMTCGLSETLIQQGLSPKIKWPNDVLLSGRKLSGTLCETSFQKDIVDVYLGIGINVNMSKEDLAKVDQPAASLKAETGKEWDRKELLLKLQRQFVSDLEKFKQHGFEPFHAQFESLLAFKDETIEVFDGERRWKGIYHSITPQGELNLSLSSGEIKMLRSGDLEIQR